MIFGSVPAPLFALDVTGGDDTSSAVSSTPVPSVSGNAGEEVAESETTSVDTASPSLPAEIEVLSFITSKGSSAGEVADVPAPTLSAGEETPLPVENPPVSLASFGEEGVVIALPISVLAVVGSAGESDGVAPLSIGGAGEIGALSPVVSGSEGEEGLPLSISGSAGEVAVIPAVIGNTGEIPASVSSVSGSAGESTLLVPPLISGGAGETPGTTSSVISGDAGEATNTKIPVVSGDAGELLDLVYVPAITGDAGEVILAVATPPIVTGDAGETTLAKVTTTPIISGDAGETTLALVTPPAVTGNTGEPNDFCTNIDGIQNFVPSGFSQNSDGSCTQQTSGGGGGGGGSVVVPVDVCSNLTGDQPTLPAGYTQNVDGTCTQSVVGGGGVPIVVDVCSNVAGAQATLPAGYTQNVDGTCTLIAVVVPGGAATTPPVVTTTARGSVGGGGGGGGGGGSYALLIVNPAVRQSCGAISMQWYTNQSSQSRVLVSTRSISDLSTSTPLLGYSFDVGTSTLNTAHSFTIPTLKGVTYFLRPVSMIPGYAPVLGSEVSFTTVDDPLCNTKGATSTETLATKTCPYITDYMKIGEENNLEQVVRLQLFLKYKEGINVPISGTFDQATEQGVHTFQNKYRGDTLDPWGPDTVSSGYVYILTQWKINELVCGDAGARPDVTSVQENRATPEQNSNAIQKIGSVNINIDQTVATSTLKTPFIIGIGTSSPNMAGAVAAIEGSRCTFFRGKTLLGDFFRFLPRAVYCVLNPLVR